MAFWELTYSVQSLESLYCTSASRTDVRFLASSFVLEEETPGIFTASRCAAASAFPKIWNGIYIMDYGQGLAPASAYKRWKTDRKQGCAVPGFVLVKVGYAPASHGAQLPPGAGKNAAAAPVLAARPSLPSPLAASSTLSPPERHH